VKKNSSGNTDYNSSTVTMGTLHLAARFQRESRKNPTFPQGTLEWELQPRTARSWAIHGHRSMCALGTRSPRAPARKVLQPRCRWPCVHRP